MDNPSAMVAYLSPILGLLLEAVLCFAGYRVQRIGIAFIGFLLGAFIGMSIAGEREGLAWLAIVLALVGGILFSILAYRMYLAGIFLLTGILAFAIAQVPLFMLHLPDWMCIAGGVVIGILVGVLAVRFTRPVLIVTTALQGSFGFVRYGLTLLGENPDQPGGWMLYAAIAAAVVLAVLGVYVQWRTSPENKTR